MENCELKRIANEVRKGIIEEVYCAQSGHPGGSLSSADIMTYLFFEEMNISQENLTSTDRDRFVLSKGHASPALYAVMAEKGFLPKEELKTFRKLGSRLQGHPSMHMLPGLDMSTGSLGQGISTAVGMAMSNKLDESANRVYTVLGDGECQEGQVWEATMAAAHYKLDNLVIMVDKNNLQIDGRVSDVMNVGSLVDKFNAFGCHVIEINGHCFDEIRSALNEAKTIKGQPTAIVCNTIKGKGVSFMEDKAGWHGVAPKEAEYIAAMKELEAK